VIALLHRVVVQRADIGAAFLFVMNWPPWVSL